MRAIRGIGWFVNACCNLLANDLADFIVDTRWDGNVLFDPGLVFDDGELDRWEELGFESSSL